MNFINTWGIPIIAFAVVLVVLLWPLRWVHDKGKYKIYFALLVILCIVFGLLMSEYAANKLVWGISIKALSAITTLYLVHIAHEVESSTAYFLMGIAVVSIMLGIYSGLLGEHTVIQPVGNEDEVNLLEAMLVGLVVGFLDYGLWKKRILDKMVQRIRS